MSDFLSRPFINVRLFDWSLLIRHLVSDSNERLQSWLSISRSSATASAHKVRTQTGYIGQNWDKYIPHDRFSDSLNWEIGNSLVEYLAEFQEFKDGSVLLRLSGWTSNIQIYTKTYINFYTWINWNISLIEDLILNFYIRNNFANIQP